MRIDFSRLPELINPVYYRTMHNRQRFNVFYGGAGSGKSHYIHQRNVYRLIAEPGHNFLILRNVSRTNRISTWPGMKQCISEWGMHSLVKYNETEMRVTAPHNGNGVVFAGLDDVEKVKSITFENGPLTDIWIEEASEISEDDLRQLDLRLRGKNAKQPFQITVSFNPVSAHHWLKSYFFDNPPEDCLTLKTTYLDNNFIDDGYRKRLESLTGVFRQVYAMGEWGVQEGLVFKDFSVKEKPDGAKFMGYGLDFGFSQDPAVLIGVYMAGDELYLDEVIYRTGMTNADLSREMKAQGVGQYARITADSAEPKSIEELHRMGWNVHPAKKGPDSIRFGLNWMLSKKICLTPGSTNLQKEFYSYSWKKDKNGKMLPEPEDNWNHGIDAARYKCLELARGGLSAPTRDIRGAIGI
jgi:phage terminase large subunit